MGEALLAVKEEVIILLLAATPIFELRAAIPGALALGYSPLHSFILGVVGNMLPVPILLMILRPMLDYFGESKYFGKIIIWIKRRTLRKSKKIEKYSLIGLFLLVAIPLPTTGAWTGCIAATLFNIRFKYSFLAILAGVICAGIIVVLLSTQAISLFSF